MNKLQLRIYMATTIQDNWCWDLQISELSSLRLWNIWVVETETLWDHKMSRLLRLVETLKCTGCWDWDWPRLRLPRLTKSCQDWDFLRLIWLKPIVIITLHSFDLNWELTNKKIWRYGFALMIQLGRVLGWVVGWVTYQLPLFSSLWLDQLN